MGLTVACVQVAKDARRPPAPVERARRRRRLGLPVRARRVRDGLDRARGRRRAARARRCAGAGAVVIAAIVLAALVGADPRSTCACTTLSDVLGGEGAAAMSFAVVAVVALVVAFVRHNGAPEQR